jgi:hypothetical protein
LRFGQRRAGTIWSLLPIIAVSIVALGLRLYRLDGRSLWLDEILSAQPAHVGGPGDVVAWSQAAINQMPVFYELIWFVGRWGDSGVILRLPAVIAGTLLIPAVYLLGRRLFGLGIGLAAAVIAAVMPYLVWYSQEARNYTILMLLTTLQMYFAYIAIKRGRVIDWLGLAVFTVLNLYTHYLALAVTAAVAAYVACFVGADLMRVVPRHVKAMLAIGILLAGVAGVFVVRRAQLRSAYAATAATVTAASQQKAASLAGAIALLIVLIAGATYLTRRSRRAKLAATGVLLMLLVFAAPVLWLTGAFGGRESIWYVAIIGALTVTAGLAALLLALDFLRSTSAASRRLELSVATGATVAIAYAPWLPTLRIFLGRPDQSLGQIHLAHPPSLVDLVSLFSLLGLTGLLLAAFVAGLVTVGVWFLRGRSAEAGVLIAWIGVPLALFTASARSAIVDIDVRYLAFMLPAAVILIGVGAHAAASGAGRAARSLRNASANNNAAKVAAIGFVALVALLIGQILPVLAAQFNTPKDDWRAAARHIAANSEPGSIVISVGDYSDWAVICLGYYFHELHAPIEVVDGNQMTSDVLDLLGQTTGTTWGVLNHLSSAQKQLLAQSTEERTDFIDVTQLIYIVRSSSEGLTMLDQARRLLHWANSLDSALSAGGAMLDASASQAVEGPNLVPEPTSVATGGWAYGPGVTVANGAVMLEPGGSETTAAFITSDLKPGDTFLAAFDHRSSELRGSQVVYAAALDATGNQLASFPGASAYACATSGNWVRSYFAFRLPANTSKLVVVLRVAGNGSAQFRSVQLSKIQ